MKIKTIILTKTDNIWNKRL